MSTRKVLSVVMATCAVLVVPVASADAAPRPVRYKNCTALNKVYKHGVARPGARDRVRGSAKPVTTFAVNAKVYQLNTRLDGDRDGIACEKR